VLIEKYLLEKGFVHPCQLHFTMDDNPNPKPVQTISVTFEGDDKIIVCVDPLSGDVIPDLPGLTNHEAMERKEKISVSKMASPFSKF